MTFVFVGRPMLKHTVGSWIDKRFGLTRRYCCVIVLYPLRLSAMSCHAITMPCDSQRVTLAGLPVGFGLFHGPSWLFFLGEGKDGMEWGRIDERVYFWDN